MRYLHLDALRAVPVTREPFEYFVVPGFVRPEARAKINADYPKISEGGSFPIAQLSYGPAFREFLDELESDQFREAFEDKFDLELAGRPTTTTVRGQCSPRDGRIHTDTKSKIITILIYINPAWENSGGRLRLLRSADDLDDMIMEVPPVEGTLLAFKRADNSARPQALRRRTQGHSVQLGYLGRRSAAGDAAAPRVGAIQAPDRRHAAGRGLNGSVKASVLSHVSSLALLSTGVFASTNIDDLFVLVGFFSDRNFSRPRIVTGQILGIATIVVISLTAAFAALAFSPAHVGLLGVAPIVIGIGKLSHLSKSEGGRHARPADFSRLRPSQSRNGGTTSA